MPLPTAAPSHIPLAPISTPSPLASNTMPNNGADPSPSPKSSNWSITPPILELSLLNLYLYLYRRHSSQPRPILPMDPKKPISSQDLFGTKMKEKKQGWCGLKWERCKDRCSECCSNCQYEVSFGVGMDF